MDSGQFAPLRHQQFQEGFERPFTPDAGIVVHEPKEARIRRQFFLRNSPMKPQPGTEQGPETLDSILVNFTKTVSVFIAGVFAPTIAHGGWQNPMLLMGEKRHIHRYVRIWTRGRIVTCRTFSASESPPRCHVGSSRKSLVSPSPRFLGPARSSCGADAPADFLLSPHPDVLGPSTT